MIWTMIHISKTLGAECLTADTTMKNMLDAHPRNYKSLKHIACFSYHVQVEVG